MSFNVITKQVPLRDGRVITLETGKLAKQSDGSVVLRMGDTMILATIVSNKDAREGIDFLPLSVDYQEKFASAGRIPGGFLKREGRLSDREVLICRLVDRALRPLFPDDYHAETQVMLYLISADADCQPDALACFAASAALAASDIPFNGPVSEVRVAKVNGELIINPTKEQMNIATLDLIVAANINDICMVEGEMNEVSEEEMLEAMVFAHEEIKIQCQALIDFTIECGTTVKREYNHENNDWDLKAAVKAATYDDVIAIAKTGNPDKNARKVAFKAVLEAHLATYAAEDLTSEKTGLIKKYYHDVEKEAMRNAVLETKQRLDGRKTNQIRPIWSEVDYLPRAHGSALFTRGETQSLTTVTLGTKLDEQMVDSAMFLGYNKFMLHYNFPGFSTGEVKPNRGPGRREVGHGNLAFRALKKVLPPEEKFPYTVRIVSDILESNGSSSMATVCAGTLALMDAGVNISGPVSGIAMGLITDETGRYAILSDILGDEDHLGDMDFKVTGTAKGITACQMDLKVNGLPFEVMKEALHQAKEGRTHILGEMMKAIETPREELKPHAPRVTVIMIPREMIGAVIGPGGKIVQEIQRESGATVTIEETKEGGMVSIFAVDKKAMDMAVGRVRGIVTEPEVMGTYVGKVKSIQSFGAFIEFMPGKDGLLHISEVKWERLPTMDGVFEIDEEVQVQLIGIDPKTGKYRLSRKALLPKPEGYVERPEREERTFERRDDRGGRGGDDRRGGGRSDDRRSGGGGFNRDRGNDKPGGGYRERGNPDAPKKDDNNDNFTTGSPRWSNDDVELI
jgi:polyribonucleotide nucleotidyltransferase